MSSEAPTRFYVYQPYGSATDPLRNEAGRLWGVGGPMHIMSGFATVKGLTRLEAMSIAAVLNRLHKLPSDTDEPPVTNRELRNLLNGLQVGEDELAAARREALEAGAVELETAFAECDTLNLLHGAARLRALIDTELLKIDALKEKP